MEFRGSKHSDEKVYEVYILLNLVGALYPSELELPAISGWSKVSPIFSNFTESFLELLRVYSYSAVP